MAHPRRYDMIQALKAVIKRFLSRSNESKSALLGYHALKVRVLGALD